MSTASKVEIYVSKRPYLKEALSEDIINYSALARKISEEKEVASREAVKAAVSRYQSELSERRTRQKSRVEEILDQTSLELKTGVSVLKERSDESIISAQTENGWTSIVEGGGKTLISMSSPVELENTPGVLEYIFSILASEGINIDHCISCREDTHLVLEGRRAPEALELLSERINSSDEGF